MNYTGIKRFWSLFLILSLMTLSVASQSSGDYMKAPDYKKIGREITNEKSHFFYDSLMARYLRGDSTMTLLEKRHLYYGYTFQPGYAPYATSDLYEKLNRLLDKKEHKKIQLDSIIFYTERILADTPFDLKALNYQLYAFDRLNDKAMFNNRLTRMLMVFDALMSSGNGLEKETAFYVIFTAHEYALVDILGFHFEGSQSLIDHYDYLTISDNPQGIKGFYFDVTPCLTHLKKMFK